MVLQHQQKSCWFNAHKVSRQFTYEKQELSFTSSPAFIFTMDKIISEDTMEKLKQLIRNRNNYLDIKEVFDNLEDSPEQSEGDVHESEKRNVVQSPSPSGDAIINDLKLLLKSARGRSSILNSDIEYIINKYSKEV